MRMRMMQSLRLLSSKSQSSRRQLFERSWWSVAERQDYYFEKGERGKQMDSFLIMTINKKEWIKCAKG